MIDLPNLIGMVGGVATVFYGVVALVAIGLLAFDRPSKVSSTVESASSPERRAA